MMKKLLLAAQLLLALTLTSCGNEDAPLTRQHASMMMTSGERIKLSVGFDNGEGSKARAMMVSSGLSDFIPQDEMGSDSYGSYPYLRWRPMRKETSKAVFTGEATEPVTLIFYHGSAAYPVAAQVKIKNVGGRYRGDIEAEIPAALSGVTRSSIEVAGVLGATSVNATTGKVTVSAPPAILEGEEMQNLPMYFPKTALSTSSDVISGIRFEFLGVLVLIPTYATNTTYAFTPEVFTFGPSRFSESEVEVDLSAGGAPKLTRTANSTYIHPLRETVMGGTMVKEKMHVLYVYPMDLGVRTPVFPTIYGTYYPMVGNQYDKAQAKKFVIPRLSNINIQQFPQGGRAVVYDMSMIYFNGTNGNGFFIGDNSGTVYSVFSGRAVDFNRRRGW
ncbi:MAG: hypothetical protein HXN07_03060 [Porphyromonadaceae bacterium]|uniref:hypothetical protein n=1 Tax=Porphyromonas sp. TaxID=1924944 RepID=UPI001CAB270D|nr:hypothetical protein [Porphyromonas sp.]MBF1363829.1 hypothetical protein [Porphyromonadaceae bacterium]MBF1377650.1 hypothetical protein [Porphyromonadaceae bacterium]MBF1382333.1 hypothetical protein [Porphyromonas sp.]